jgi:predicted DNA-binding ribbon-helix-helix protein
MAGKRVMTIIRFAGNRITLLASITVDIVIYLVLGLLWPFAAACAVVLGLVWANARVKPDANG